MDNTETIEVEQIQDESEEIQERLVFGCSIDSALIISGLGLIFIALGGIVFGGIIAIAIIGLGLWQARITKLSIRDLFEAYQGKIGIGDACERARGRGGEESNFEAFMLNLSRDHITVLFYTIGAITLGSLIGAIASHH